MEEISNNLEYNNNNFEKTCKVDEENILLQENNFQEFSNQQGLKFLFLLEFHKYILIKSFLIHDSVDISIRSIISHEDTNF